MRSAMSRAFCCRKWRVLCVLLVAMVISVTLQIVQTNLGLLTRTQSTGRLVLAELNNQHILSNHTRSVYNRRVSTKQEKKAVLHTRLVPGKHLSPVYVQNIHALNATQQDKKRAEQASSGEKTAAHLYRNITKECSPLADPPELPTPFKFYIYDLPAKFNTDIQKLMTEKREFSFCYNLDYCGSGEELYQYPGTEIEQKQNLTSQNYITSVRNTHQFALEVIIHYRLMHSPYRTLDPSKANIFYIPAYTGLACLSHRNKGNQFVADLFSHLRAKEAYFTGGKPHFSTLSKIQREQGSESCGTLLHPDTKNITFIAIEKEANPSWALYRKIPANSIIISPYPSYVHFIPTIKEKALTGPDPNISEWLKNSKFKLHVPSLSERNVKLLLASGTRRSNPFRAIIIDQFTRQTSDGYANYFGKTTNNNSVTDIMLQTPECSSTHRSTTIPWMHRSVFCLQPPGDSPTRKSFYDSILSGCIPVIFSLKYKTEYPFEKWFDYSKFTFTIEEKLVSRYNKKVIDILQGIPQHKVESMHEYLLHIAKWFQYSLSDGSIHQGDDAVTLILQQLKETYNL